MNLHHRSPNVTTKALSLNIPPLLSRAIHCLSTWLENLDPTYGNPPRSKCIGSFLGGISLVPYTLSSYAGNANDVPLGLHFIGINDGLSKNYPVDRVRDYLLSMTNNSAYKAQVLFGGEYSYIYYRHCDSGTWGNWVRVQLE